MKNLFNLFFFSILTFSFLFTSSCKKEEISRDVFDFKTFKSEIENDLIYINHIQIGNQLFQQLVDNEIAIFDIQNELNMRNVKSYCDVELNILKGFNGASKFIEGFCGLTTGMEELEKYRDQFNQLSKTQFQELFSFQYNLVNDINQVSTRANCISVFQGNMNHVYNVCIAGYGPPSDDCYEGGLTWAIQNYEDCCTNEWNTGC